MEAVRYEQLREILALQVLPELREIRRRQTVLQATVWVGMACLLSGMVILLGLMGVLLVR
jgi:hypothetical protein